MACHLTHCPIWDQRLPSSTTTRWRAGPSAHGSHLLKPVGRAGTYDVFLNGSGGGQVSAVFRWPTPVDGPLPEPEALLAGVTNDRSRKITSYGVGLEISNLAATPTVSAPLSLSPPATAR